MTLYSITSQQCGWSLAMLNLNNIYYDDVETTRGYQILYILILHCKAMVIFHKVHQIHTNVKNNSL